MRLTTKDICHLVAAHTGVSVEDIKSLSRKRKVARARQAVLYIARQQGMSYPVIGARMGRDHSTVIYACEQVPELAKRDPKYAAMIEAVSRGEWPENQAPSYVPTYAPIIRLPKVKANPIPQHDNEDSAHLFHKEVAKGSAALLAALLGNAA